MGGSVLLAGGSGRKLRVVGQATSLDCWRAGVHYATTAQPEPALLEEQSVRSAAAEAPPSPCIAQLLGALRGLPPPPEVLLDLAVHAVAEEDDSLARAVRAAAQCTAARVSTAA